SGRGLLTRVRGGASVDPDTTPESARTRRAGDHAASKRRIGAAAAAMVESGSTVLLSGGTTTEAMLPFLADLERVTVLTNNLTVAFGLAHLPGVDTVVLGGVVRAEEMSLLGPIVETTLAGFNVDVAFCGAFGIDADAGVSGAHALEASTD
ncbi:DeoR/GlpR family DNA-binding transcription regulator, partial [Myxococcus sp. AB025B]|uniref:DeoR/GlpR family DNA-binding transcription regulator n=1 Tax=Myxococcus sp. AB025B TaxID=2562794 RepID=UPI001144BBB6